MKRRSNPTQRSGKSPYQKRHKIPYPYPGWVRDQRQPIPAEIQEQLRKRVVA